MKVEIVQEVIEELLEEETFIEHVQQVVEEVERRHQLKVTAVFVRE